VQAGGLKQITVGKFVVYKCDSWKWGKFQPQKFGPVCVKKRLLETCVMGNHCTPLHI
jgi:hypothetical protein